MDKRRNKITNIAIILMVILAVPALIYGERYQANQYKVQAEKSREEGKLDEALSYYKKGYRLAPRNRDIVHGYVGGLIYFDKNAEAYSVISKYVKDTPKDSYWEDMDIWVDKSITELATKRCLDAGVSANHILSRTLEADENNKIAGAVMVKARECVKN